MPQGVRVRVSPSAPFARHLCGGHSSVGRAPDCDSGGRGFEPHCPPHYIEKRSTVYADVVELVDTPDLGSGAAMCESSSLSVRTIYDTLMMISFSEKFAV